MELENDISILNISELNEDEEGPLSVVDNCSQESTSSRATKGLNVLGLLRQNFIGNGGNLTKAGAGNRKTYVAMNPSNQDDSSREIQSLKGSIQRLQNECDSLSESNNKYQHEILRLRDQVSCLFRENCSLKEQSAKLGIDNHSTQKQYESLRQDNSKLRERLQQISLQLRYFVRNKDGAKCLASSCPQLKPVMDGSLPSLSKSLDHDVVRGKQSASIDQQQIRAFVDKVQNENSRVFSLDLDHENLEQISRKLLEQIRQENVESERQNSKPSDFQKSPSQLSILAGDMMSTSCSSLESAKDKELVTVLETCRSSSKLLKQEAHMQNQLLKAMFRQLDLIQKLQKTTTSLQQQSEADKSKISPSFSPKGILNEIMDTGGSSQIISGKKCPGGREPPLTPKSAAPLPDSTLETLLRNYDCNVEEDGPLCLSIKDMNECCSAGPNESDDRICPMCQAVFPKAIPLPEFEAHVMEHFRSEEFEIITQEPDHLF